MSDDSRDSKTDRPTEESSADRGSNELESAPTAASAPVSPTEAPTADAPVSRPSAAAADVLSIGDMIADRYRVLRFIASGGMGEVYEVEDVELNERVALKTIRSDVYGTRGGVERFKREIHLARKVTHPNVCRVFEYGHHTPAGGSGGAEVLFLTMELLEGESLHDRITRVGSLTPAEALPVVDQMAEGLAAAHRQGIVHRDFKSANVMLVPMAEGERAVVTDFGIARQSATDRTGVSTLTSVGEVLGTPHYMAPEQVKGEPAGPAADIFALGVVMFEMVTGKRPFSADSAFDVAMQRLQKKPPSPRSLTPDLDPVWERTILRCLETEPRNRFATVYDVVKALGVERVAPGRRSRRTLIMAAAGALAAAVVLGFSLSKFLGWPFGGLERDAPAMAGVPAVEVRPSLAVIGFRNLGGPEADWISTALSEMLRTELAIGDELITIPGENVARMKVELSLANTDSLAKDTLSAVASILRADYVVLGSYLVLSGTPERDMRFDWRVQDTRNGLIVRADQESGSESDLFDLVAGAGSKLRETLDFRPLSQQELAEVQASMPTDRDSARLYSAGLEKLRVFDAVEARTLLERAAIADPNHPLIHSALSAAWSALGYDARALEEARIAADLSSGLPRKERLLVEGRLHELNGEWGDAIKIYQGLFVVFPDDLENGLRFARAQVSAGEAMDALSTIINMRKLPPPAANDPRLGMAEAEANKFLTDFEGQREAAASATRIAEAMGARILFATAKLSECEALVNLLRMEEARSACSEARDVFRITGFGAGIARADSLVAVSHARTGDLESAGRLFDRALSEARRTGNRSETIKLLTNVGNVHSAQGRFDEAKEAFMEALDIADEIGDKQGASLAWNAIAVTLEEEGQLDEAVEAYARALKTFQEIGAQRWVAIIHYNLGYVRQLQGRPDLARGDFERSVTVNRQLGLDIDGAESLVALGEVLIELGKTGEARATLSEAMDWYVDAADAEGEATVREIIEQLGPPG